MSENTKNNIVMYIGGTVFGLGLGIAGAIYPEVTLEFLELQDLGLLIVIGAGLLITMISYQLLPRIFNKPLWGNIFSTKGKNPIESRTILGAILFGIGWGISGLCPATSVAAIGAGNYPVLIGIAGIFLGTLLFGLLKSSRSEQD